MLAKRTDKLQASGIRKIFDLIHTMKNPINLSIGQAHFDLPQPIKDVAIKAIYDGFNKYAPTQGLPELVDRLKKHIATATGAEPDSVVVTNGASGGLFLTFQMLLNSGDEVLVPDPYFIMYANLIQMCGGIPVYIDTYPEFKLTPEKIERAVTPKTKILILNTPVNPTGIAYTDSEIKEIVELIEKHGILLISDEVYDHFIYDFPHSSPLKYYKDRTVYINAFSKTLGIAGWRIGYAAFPKWMYEKTTTLQQFSFVCTPAPFQKAVLAGLDYDMSDQYASYKQKRDLTYDLLKNTFDVVKPQGAFYIFPKVPRGTDMDFVQAAVDKNVLIVPGSACSRKNTHFRMSFAVEDEQLKKGIEILKKIAYE
ncbi:MAG: aminotransferase class I/II-fold pyridoxal phosphate-dependent enzyme [Planctomycetes bacterium]|nr:aminotransferase class I/II-fold pyridoxal phosphate-dependent enzyme [Planctomycetota bacterium]